MIFFNLVVHTSYEGSEHWCKHYHNPLTRIQLFFLPSYHHEPPKNTFFVCKKTWIILWLLNFFVKNIFYQALTMTKFSMISKEKLWRGKNLLSWLVTWSNEYTTPSTIQLHNPAKTLTKVLFGHQYANLYHYVLSLIFN